MGAKNRLYYGVDPGETHIGVAVFNLTRMEWSHYYETDSIYQVCNEIADTLPELVIVEDFQLSPQLMRFLKGSKLHTVRHIGAIQISCEWMNVPFKTQRKADVTFMTNENMRSMDLWTPGEGEHVRDAQRHVLAYLARSGRINALLELV